MKKSGGFQNDLYPPIRSTEPAMTFDNYISNQDKEPLRVEVKPDAAHVFTSKSVSITQSVSSPAQTVYVEVSSPSDKQEITELNKKLQEMMRELEFVRQQSSHLQVQVNELNESNERLAGENQMLKSELNDAHGQIANLNQAQNNGPATDTYQAVEGQQQNYEYNNNEYSHPEAVEEVQQE